MSVSGSWPQAPCVDPHAFGSHSYPSAIQKRLQARRNTQRFVLVYHQVLKCNRKVMISHAFLQAKEI